MRASRHADTNLQVLVQKRIIAILGPLDRQRSDRRSVEQELDLVRLRVPQALDVPGVAPREQDLDVVLSVLHERVTRRKPATRADRKSRHMVFLRDVGRDADDVALQGRLGGANRQPADLLRSGDVSIQQRRGQVADCDVVEAVTAFIGRQERGGIDIDSQQIADSVLILSAIETP
jgi:hypothetical protein